MSGSAAQWAAAQRILLAEHEKYGDGPVRFDPAAQRLRSVKAMEDPHYDITDQTLPADRLSSRILDAVVEALSDTVPDAAALRAHADRLAGIVTSHPPGEWHAVYCNVVARIISAAKGVDGQGVSEMLAGLVAALADRGELVNPLKEGLVYDIGDYWVRPVVIPPGEALTGDGGGRIWSEMPMFGVWVSEELDKFPREGRLVDAAEMWPGQSWENFVRFCRRLSQLHTQGSSRVSALRAEHGLKVFDLILTNQNGNLDSAWWRMAAVYVDIFGDEVYGLCRDGSSYGAEVIKNTQQPENGSLDPVKEWFSLEKWASWKAKFGRLAARLHDQASRKTALKAFEEMQRIESD